MALPEITFRPFQAKDLPQLRTLNEAAMRATDAFIESDNHKGGQYDDLDDIQANYLDMGGNFLVGTITDEVVAMGAFRKLRDDVAEIKRMRVKPDLQGQGIGRDLLMLIEDQVRAAHYRVIELNTRTKQTGARHLYEKQGYTEVRRQTEGYPLEVIFYQKEVGSIA